MFKKILVPVDGSQTSWKALETGKSLAEKYDGVLVVITVMLPYGAGGLLQMSLDQTLIDQNNAAMKKPVLPPWNWPRKNSAAIRVKWNMWKKPGTRRN